MDNIILIGMPAVGKSTVGVVVAKRLGYRFIDTDILIQEEEGNGSLRLDDGKTGQNVEEKSRNRRWIRW